MKKAAVFLLVIIIIYVSAIAEHSEKEIEKIKNLHRLAETSGNLSVEKRLAHAKEALQLSIKIDDDKSRANSLKKIGKIYREINNFEKALEYYLSALKILEKIDDRKSVSITLNSIGIIYKRLNRYGKALTAHLRSLKLKEKLGDREGMHGVMNNIGLVYIRVHDYDRSAEYFLGSLKIKEELGDKKGISTCLNNLGLLYKHLKNYNKALDYHLRSLQIKEELDDREGVSRTLNNIGLLYSEMGENRKALAFLLRSLQMKREFGNKEAVAASLNNIGLVYKRLFNYDRALQYSVQALKIKEEIGDKEGIGKSLNNIGLIYRVLEDFDTALEYHQNSLRVNEEIANQSGVAKALNNIGLVYRGLKDYNWALESFQKAKRIYGELGDKEGISSSLNNLALVYRALKSFDKALSLHHEALQLSEEIDDNGGIAVSLNNIGYTHMDLNRYEKALPFFLRSLSLIEEIGDKYGEAEILVRLGQIYSNLKNFDKAARCLERSLELAKGLQAKDVIRDSYKTYSEFYLLQKDYRKSLEYFKLFEAEKSSLFNRESSNRFSRLRAKLDVEKQEKKLLEKENNIKMLKLNRQKYIRRVYGFAAIMFIILTFLIFVMYRSKSKSSKELKIALERNLYEVEERKKVEEEKQKLQEQLFHSQKLESLGRLAGGIAHDFNNLLTTITGYAELLKLEFKDEKTQEGRAAAAIFNTAITASNLTSQLLGFARRGKYHIEFVDLNKLVEETVGVSEKIFEKKIEVTFELDRSLGAVKADKNQVVQVLTNLIINAKDAMPGGGRLIFRTEEVQIQEAVNHPYPKILKPGQYILLTVSDNGTGMTKEISDRVFEPFFTTKDKSKGTGLGLATVYGIVKNHNGYIFCDSEPGKGTRFSIFLPAVETGVVKEPEKIKTTAGVETILVVDDEPSVLNISETMLKELGYRVLSANDGDEAITIYKKKKDRIDLVLLDIVMPKKDGKEVFYDLKEIDPDVKVLLFSGYTKEGATEILDAGAIGFMKKPFTIGQLSETIDGVLKV